MPARRKSHQGNAGFVQAILFGIVVEEGDCPVAVLDLGGKHGLGAPTVVDRGYGDALIEDGRESIAHVTHVGVFVVDQPATAVDENEQGAFTRGIGRKVNVEQVFFRVSFW